MFMKSRYRFVKGQTTRAQAKIREEFHVIQIATKGEKFSTNRVPRLFLSLGQLPTSLIALFFLLFLSKQTN